MDQRHDMTHVMTRSNDRRRGEARCRNGARRAPHGAAEAGVKPGSRGVTPAAHACPARVRHTLAAQGADGVQP
jgi:hypothetical protein